MGGRLADAGGGGRIRRQACGQDLSSWRVVGGPGWSGSWRGGCGGGEYGGEGPAHLPKKGHRFSPAPVSRKDAPPTGGRGNVGSPPGGGLNPHMDYAWERFGDSA